MVSSREGSPRPARTRGLRAMGRAARLVVVGLAWSAVGCHVEYAGMTLPSGKYMFDDVQYFPPGPDFPWANTQAATQRARMRAMGFDPGPSMPTGPIGPPPRAAGAPDPTQNIPGRPTNINVQEPQGPVPAPNGAPAPAPNVAPGNVPPPPAPGGDADMPGGGVPAPGAGTGGGDLGPK